ncbi:MAG: MBL fold metallo-hydrolase [Betaproteobacteria bacterium HGW-Betaproteobacteria-12]|nr:MAG: MBL fold metallo-hydrolase [Betaproteobacteria bacterium HGW-Betaproteobacteria-12]
MSNIAPLQLFDPASSSFTYILVDPDSRQGLIIDPVDEQIDRDLAVLAEQDIRLLWAVETHGHADHITSAGLLAEHTGAQTAAPAGCGITTASRQLQDGDTLTFGDEWIQALHTPGHTAGSMCYRWRHHVFTGDTLLVGTCGRTDFQSGSPEALYDSLTRVLFALPDDTVVWPGHDYQGHTQTSIGAEKAGNTRVAGRSREQFVALMNALNLPRPRRMDEALPANLSSGRRHDAGGGELASVRPAVGYAGDVAPQLAYAWWQAGEAVLVDVRTDAEREWVGFIPGAVALAWKQWPAMTIDAAFGERLRHVVPAGKKVLMLCRSGVRSVAAAQRATELGFAAYNIVDGFEGAPDTHAHRGNLGGWRHLGLPWRQG